MSFAAPGARLTNLELRDAANLMREAIAHRSGLKMVARDHQAALKLRRQLYGARRRARQRADETLDGLSILVRGREVLLIAGAKSPGAPMEGIESIVPLTPDEVPTSIGSRGVQKLGLREAAAILDLFANVHLPPGIR